MDLITFCASHITNKTRIPLLLNVIESILNQTDKTLMYISISYEDIVLGKDIKISPHPYLKVFYHQSCKKVSLSISSFYCIASIRFSIIDYG